jgi:hypothetical protein
MRRAFTLVTLALSAAAPAAGQSHLIVISGLSGEPKYAESFHSWATTLIDAAQERWSLPESSVVYLAEKTERDPGRIAARSTRENVERTLLEAAERVGPDDVVFIVLIGHGSTRDGESRFNLPGPDMTAADFGRLLDDFAYQKIVFVNCSSASGEFIAALSGPNRTIITATRSGREQNETIFAGYFVAAFAGDVADVDKDERISALEAFNYARTEVIRAYEADGLLLTEHAQLDDNGDGQGSAEPDPHTADGALARTMFLVSAAGPVAVSDSRLAALYDEKRGLEEQIAALRQLKDEMATAEYEQQLEELLIELALKTREIRELEGQEKE